jgi:EmrB/QacA subfamily drug resistance transporter
MTSGTPHDVTPAPGGAGVRLGEPSGRWVLLAAVLGSGMAFVDQTGVNVALPRIGRDLDASLPALQWTVNGYTLTLAAFILLGGSLGDRLGRRRVFLLGTAWFALASLLCAVATGPGVLIAARALQGLGGALLTPGSLALVQASFVPEHRARAIGAWSGLLGAAGAAGPLLGGWLVDAVSWRAVFLLNLPLALVVLLVAGRHVPADHPAATTAVPTVAAAPAPATTTATAPAASAGHRPGRFDWPGAALGAVGLAALTEALVLAGEGGAGAPVAVATGVAGVLTLAGFVLVERRTAEPMVPPELFASRRFTVANLVTFVMYAALGGLMFLLGLQLQVAVGFSAFGAGAAMLPSTVLMLLFSARTGALADRVGPRLPMTVGPAVAAAGVLALTRVGPDPAGRLLHVYLTEVLPAVTLFGIGLTLTVAPLTATVLAAAPADRVGLASGVNNAVARVAGLLAVAGLPVLAGLGGAANRDPLALDAGFGVAMRVCSGLLLAGALVAWVGLRGPRPG